MDPVDGNAIGGWLFELFGQDMTDHRFRCEHCGAVALIAETDVYDHAPGVVARCRACARVVLVISSIRSQLRVQRYLEFLGRPSDGG